jgi:hypothetical protein
MTENAVSALIKDCQTIFSPQGIYPQFFSLPARQYTHPGRTGVTVVSNLASCGRFSKDLSAANKGGKEMTRGQVKRWREDEDCLEV